MDTSSLAGAVAYVTVGFAAGVLSGMFGVGGAVLTTPGVRALGTSPIDAVGSTIPAILPGAISGAYRYAKAGMVDWRIGLVCGGAGAAFAIGGAWVSDLVDARWLMVITAALLAWSGASSLRVGLRERRQLVDETTPGAPTPPDRGADAAHPSQSSGSLGAVGALAGFVAGLLGVGGGVIMMPLFTTVLRIPIKVAVASSLVAVAIFSVPAMVAHTVLGHIDWAVALLLLAGTVPGAQVGARLTLGRSDAQVRILLGIFFLVIAIVYGSRELESIL